tara:strand:- start:165 stop:437 length:273 start_codon:yes stop_codon:yes gene_type:complete
MMKIEFNTGDNFSTKPYFYFFFTSVIILVIIIISNISLKLSNISKHYEINHLCRLLRVDKSSSNFKKISKFTKLKNKEKIWELCRDNIKY